MSSSTKQAAPTEADLSRHAGDGLRIAFGIAGLVAVVLGLFMLFAPATSAKTAVVVLAALIGIYAIVTGAIYLGTAVFSRAVKGWARTGHALLGLLYLVAGVIMMANLLTTGTFVALFIAISIGVLWIIEGIMAFTLIKSSPAKVSTGIFAGLSIVAGIVLICSPLMGVAVLWILLGASLVVLGAVQAVRAFKLKH